MWNLTSHFLKHTCQVCWIWCSGPDRCGSMLVDFTQPSTCCTNYRLKIRLHTGVCRKKGNTFRRAWCINPWTLCSDHLRSVCLSVPLLVLAIFLCVSIDPSICPSLKLSVTVSLSRSVSLSLTEPLSIYAQLYLHTINLPTGLFTCRSHGSHLQDLGIGTWDWSRHRNIHQAYSKAPGGRHSPRPIWTQAASRWEFQIQRLLQSIYSLFAVWAEHV